MVGSEGRELEPFRRRPSPQGENSESATADEGLEMQLFVTLIRLKSFHTGCDQRRLNNGLIKCQRS